MTRRELLGAALIAGLPLAAYPTVFEPRWLELTKTNVKMPLWSPSKPVRALHLADFHSSFLVPDSLIERAIAMGIEQRPDFACITGDFITTRVGFNAEALALSLQKLSSRMPTYAVYGNHDGGISSASRGGFEDHTIVKQILDQGGVRLLHNALDRISIRGQELQIAGVGDLWSDEIDGDAAFRYVDTNLPTVLLSHNPDSKRVLGEQPWHLMLCGHTHGGQVLVPFEGPRYAPVHDKRFVAGLKQWRDRQIYTTRGVGNLGSVRFRCRPEVTILDLV